MVGANVGEMALRHFDRLSAMGVVTQMRPLHHDNSQLCPRILDQVDLVRLDASRTLDPTTRSLMGQYMTPQLVATFMASMLMATGPNIHILDPGAGVGSLFSAVVDRLCDRETRPQRITVTAYELDPRLAEYARQALALCRQRCEDQGIAFSGQVINDDFIAVASNMIAGNLLSSQTLPQYNCAIVNPPYRKINVDSPYRLWLRQLGCETSNLYTGFIAAVIRLLNPNGELVAITPRSFCNGLYFRSFRELLLTSMTIKRAHVFEARDKAFGEDDVLQENIIYHAVKDSRKGPVLISSSDGFAGPDDGHMEREIGYDQLVYPHDPDLFIHIVPDEMGGQVAAQVSRFSSSLTDLGLSVSTGRVVDFRALPFIHDEPQMNTVPLIYPLNFNRGGIEWPRFGRKPQAILNTTESIKLLVPNDCYVLTKRFSSKEETRRVVAAVLVGGHLPGEVIGIENHINYFHRDGRGLPLDLAKGLTAFLNSTLVDMHFRQFSGHTQVNATDLRNMRYPTLNQLTALGQHIGDEFPTQNELDDLIQRELLDMDDVNEGNPVQAKRRMDEALAILKALGLPRAQQNERSALTLLALLDLKPHTSWSESSNPLCGITQMMGWFATYYGKTYAPNTRETVRRQTVHQFIQAGLIVANPDLPNRSVNSPKAVYQIDPRALDLLRTFDTPEWETTLSEYRVSQETLATRYAAEREKAKIPVVISSGETINLTPGGQNVLVKEILSEFAPRFVPGGKVLYVGDAGDKFAYFDREGLAQFGLHFDTHGKMPDVVIHHQEKNWLLLIEAVTSHGPINPKRHIELKDIFSASTAGLVFVTTFLTRKAMVKYLSDISWETEVWVAETPSHMIHFNGERFLGPYNTRSAP